MTRRLSALGHGGAQALALAKAKATQSKATAGILKGLGGKKAASALKLQARRDFSKITNLFACFHCENVFFSQSRKYIVQFLNP